MEANSQRTMQVLANMLEKSHVKVPQIPTVPKSHDDRFLSSPNKSIGERGCICEEKCLAKFVAMARYGPNNDKGFVCKEFLLPDQYRDFLDGKGLPSMRGKCLMCSRYYQVCRSRKPSPQ